MGSLENGVSLKKDQNLLRSSSVTGRNSGAFGQRQVRSRFARFLFVNKINYLQWICTVAVFFFFVVLFQMFLPGSVMEKSRNLGQDSEVRGGDLALLKELGGLDFGEDIKFEPLKVLAKFHDEVVEANGTVASRTVVRFGYRKPKLALVFANLLVDPYQIMMANVAAALREIGYEIEVLSIEDGPVRSIWKDVGVPVVILNTDGHRKFSLDWLNYDGLLVNSLEAVNVLSCVMQEPFKNVPLVWTVNELTLASRLKQYISSGQNDLVDNWRKVFSRANVVVFPNYILPIGYSECDAGNYFVIPSSPKEAWEVDTFMAVSNDNSRAKMNYAPENFVIVVVGSQLLYKGLWLEQALVLQALLPVFPELMNDGNSNSRFKIVVLTEGPNTNYSVAVEAIARNLSYPEGMVKHVAPAEDTDITLSVADLVIYASLREEQSFPNTLLKAMCFGKPIVAPDLPMIKKYVDDKVNGYLFPKENVNVLAQIMLQVVSNGELSLLARKAASVGQHTARNLMVSESVEGYALLLENILRFPSEVAYPKAVTEIPEKPKAEWQWQLFEAIETKYSQNNTLKTTRYLNEFERQWNPTEREGSAAMVEKNEEFLYSIWEDHTNTEIANVRKRREDEELKGRTDQPRGTWEEVYRSAKRADRSRNDLRERDEGELERTGQPLCIYEPYFGQGTWPFLHSTSLYRGLGLSSKGRRPGHDDVDAPSRLQLLNNPYYRDVLGEYGAFFAVANRIDRIHKNTWIGFQSWRATARQQSLSKTAEKSLLDAIEARRHGDTLYFWARMDVDPRNPLKQDFWSFCDTLNAGNCQFAFAEALKKMYGLKQNSSSLPPMPVDGGTWSVMHSWVLPTKSFVEFVMFSRMFVDALDSQFYEDHHRSGRCYLSLTKDKHCYSRVIEMLVNVWAYHSARRMMYVDPQTGLMEEQHKLKNRRGKMWVKWFQFNTLKSMDEELAEEADTDRPKTRWLWPSTGEVFWQGIYEKERHLKNKEKEKRRQQSKDKIKRIKNRTHQKALGKYVKPPPEELENSNTTTTATARRMR
ncbi:Glycosyl transferase family 1 protein isoform 2 [Capsicum annuum]|uniref:Uncharacterized protein n=1 Tax=Capsicum annuum TaxID=4072 RepID=A0A2G2YXW0_CAPAN|nr:uncharacterized protein LOC107839250 [Capsicum annuum]KAF3620090.1 Glycosyl transferase family 1 protein isoform 2 [Capsicum annuum]PHT74592.1 hypothetical protein T459_21869 [Capsicum annuum]